MRTASTGFLVDTNVLVYAYDVRDAAKQARAIDVLERMEENQLGALSVQILGEFFVTITRKLSQPFTPLEAERRVNSFVRSWLVLDITEAMVVEAVRGVSQHKWSYWDSLVWATAKVNGVPTVMSEDFSDGALVEGVRFLNPFAATFDLTLLERPS